MRLTRFATACGTALLTFTLNGCADGPPRAVQPPLCGTGQLSLRAGPADAGMGHVTRTLVLERRGGGTCLLHGTPQLQLLDAHDAPLPTVQRGIASPLVPGRMPPMIRLEPGAAAHFTVHYATATGYGGAHCPTASALAVTPPGAKSALRLALPIAAYGGTLPTPVCGELRVSALWPGAS